MDHNEDIPGQDGGQAPAEEAVNTPAEPTAAQPSESGDPRLSQWLNAISQQPKQPYAGAADQPVPDAAGPAAPGQSAPASSPQAPPAPSADEYKKPSARSERTARMVAKTIDLGFSKTAQYIADEPTREKYKADDQELEDLIDMWADYIESEGLNLPPWLGLLFTILVIYGVKVPQIIKDRKKNIALQKAAEAKARALAFAAAGISPAPQPKPAEPPPLSSVDTPRTNCMHPECGKALREDQIKQGRQFCSTKCSNSYRALVAKRAANTIISIPTP